MESDESDSGRLSLPIQLTNIHEYVARGQTTELFISVMALLYLLN